MHAHMMYKRNILYFAKQNVHEKRANILYWRRGNGAWTTSLQEKDICPHEVQENASRKESSVHLDQGKIFSFWKCDDSQIRKINTQALK